MFLENSRYAKVPQVESRDREGRAVKAVKLRRLPVTACQPYGVQPQDRLDLLADQLFKQPTQFWKIADANTELKANDLAVNGREIELPK